jgi:methionyl-tRNA synthetase
VKILVTAALPYANGPLHLGHIRSTYLPADIYARYQRLAGNEVLYVCATDEHGTPIVAGAEKQQKTPKEFVDYYHKKDAEEFAALGFSFDIFHRTSSKENKEMTQYFFKRLNDAGHIYTKEVELPYCSHDKRFLPDRFIVGTCPHCKAEKQYSDYCENCGKTLSAGEILNPVCITCGKKPVHRISKHYFFKLASFSDKLHKYLSENKNLQSDVTNYVLNWVKDGLVDWDISRDLEWGVPVPGEKDMVFYVWFDAPIGYVSSTKALTKKWEEFWKKDSQIVHFIGKDIVYHHFLFWPAMLMGVGDGFRAPDKMAVRGYLNLEGRKFSKSKNWFVSIEDFLASYPPDYLRYYQTAFTPHSTVDADFVWKDFQSRINNELVANVGNYVNRALVLVQKMEGGSVPRPEGLDEMDQKMLGEIAIAREKVAVLIDGFKLKEGQEEIFSLSSEFNKYLSDKSPWKEKDAQKNANTLYVCIRGISALSILLEPYLPFSAQKMQQMLCIGKEQVKWANAEVEIVMPGTKLGEVKPLYVKVSDEQIAKEEEKLRGNSDAQKKLEGKN